MIQTYSNSEKISITQTLNLYKALLNSDPTKIFQEEEKEVEDVYRTMINMYDKKRLTIVFNLLKIIEEEKNPIFKGYYIKSLLVFFKPINENIRIWVKKKIAS